NRYLHASAIREVRQGEMGKRLQVGEMKNADRLVRRAPRHEAIARRIKPREFLVHSEIARSGLRRHFNSPRADRQVERLLLDVIVHCASEPRLDYFGVNCPGWRAAWRG